MKRYLLVTLLFALIAVVCLFVDNLGRKPFCINSRLVEKVDIRTLSGLSHIGNCWTNNSGKEDYFLVEIIKGINGRLASVDSFLGLILSQNLKWIPLQI